MYVLQMKYLCNEYRQMELPVRVYCNYCNEYMYSNVDKRWGCLASIFNILTCFMCFCIAPYDIHHKCKYCHQTISIDNMWFSD